MSVFENFPYTNFHNLNLDWVLNKLKSFEERLSKIEKDGGGTAPDITGLEAKIDAKQDKLTFDSAPTQNSTNPVTSGGVYTAIDSTTTTLNNSLNHVNTALEDKIAAKQDKLTFDSAPTQNSTNPVTSGGVYTAIDNTNNTLRDTVDYIDGKVDNLDGKVDHLDGEVNQLDGKVDRLDGRVGHLETDIDEKQNKLTFDTEPTRNSDNPVTSGGVHTALGNIEKEFEDQIIDKQDKLRFDFKPRIRSTYPVESKGIYEFVKDSQLKSIFKTYDNNSTGYSLTANTFVKITDSSLAGILTDEHMPDIVVNYTVAMISFAIYMSTGSIVRTAVVGYNNCHDLISENGEHKLYAPFMLFDSSQTSNLDFIILLNHSGIYIMHVGDPSVNLHVDKLNVEIMYYDVMDTSD